MIHEARDRHGIGIAVRPPAWTNRGWPPRLGRPGYRSSAIHRVLADTPATPVPDSRVIVIEGIPGAGKTTLHERLLRALASRPVYSFPEESLLFGWQHVALSDLDAMRLALMNRLLDLMDAAATTESDAIFLLTRFHLSYAVLAGDSSSRPYRQVIERLAAHSVHVLMPVVPHEEIETRAAHAERANPMWRRHLQRRLARLGAKDLTAQFSLQQDWMLRLINEQRLPHTLLAPMRPESAGRVAAA